MQGMQLAPSASNDEKQKSQTQVEAIRRLVFPRFHTMSSGKCSIILTQSVYFSPYFTDQSFQGRGYSISTKFDLSAV